MDDKEKELEKEKEEIDGKEGGDNPDPDTQSQIQTLMTEVAKLKRSLDKASSEAADYKKKWRQTLSEQEQASEEKAEAEAKREEEYQRLLKENQVGKLEKQFLVLGYSDEQAVKAAEAQYDGDVDTLFKIQQEVQQASLKKAEAEWIKSRPDITDNGKDGKGKDDAIEAFKRAFGGF